MTIREAADEIQLATLTRILDDYCEQAGIEGTHPAREHLARRLIALFTGGIDSPDHIRMALDGAVKISAGQTVIRSAAVWPRYRDLAKAAADLDVERGHRRRDHRADFGELRRAITRRQHDLLVAFDLLHLNGHDLRNMPLEDRRYILAELIPPDIRIQFSKPLPRGAKAIFLPGRPGRAGKLVSKRKEKLQAGAQHCPRRACVPQE